MHTVFFPIAVLLGIAMCATPFAPARIGFGLGMLICFAVGAWMPPEVFMWCVLVALGLFVVLVVGLLIWEWRRGAGSWGKGRRDALALKREES